MALSSDVTVRGSDLSPLLELVHLWYQDVCVYRFWHDWQHARSCVCYPCVMKHWPMSQGALHQLGSKDFIVCRHKVDNAAKRML